jgi:hypothetical protein
MLKQVISRSHEKNAKRAFRDFIRPKIELSRIIHSPHGNRLQDEAISVPTSRVDKHPSATACSASHIGRGRADSI